MDLKQKRITSVIAGISVQMFPLDSESAWSSQTFLLLSEQTGFKADERLLI